MTQPVQLPVFGVTVLERRDAVRNRRRIVAAAEELFARHGVDAVSLDQIAVHAGVGKGTLFRRFGDRSGLLRAVLNDGEAAFQERLIRGAAPLGPGPPAHERLLAFGPAVIGLLGLQGELIRAAEGAGPSARFNSAVYSVYHAHLRMLLAEAAPDLDAEYTADALLAPLAADLCLAQQRGGMSLERLADGWRALAERVLGVPEPAEVAPRAITA